MYPATLKRIIEDLQKLPGIGEKTAERLALHMVTQFDEADIDSFSTHLTALKDSIHPCPICGMLTDQPTCEVCSDDTRDRTTIMVVADPKDVFVMEKMATYRGLYHVLGGLIDFSRGITEKELNIDTLETRISGVKELILATNGTVEGEMTAKFIKAYFEDKPLMITRLASGLPVGADLKYADDLTLSKAVENRMKY